jgi:hypothetical protein
MQSDFGLMNVMNQVEHVLELTTLDRVFEFCSVRDKFHLLAPWPVEQANQRMLTDNCNCSVKGQDAHPAVQRDSLLGAAAGCAQELATVPGRRAESVSCWRPGFRSSSGPMTAPRIIRKLSTNPVA